MSPNFGKTMIWLVGIYILFCAIPYLFENQLVFQGRSLPLDYKFTFKGEFEEFNIPMMDGIQLNALLFKTQQPKKGLILYCHGNADHLKRWGTYRNDLLQRGYDVLMYDYRGYGKSAGSPQLVLLLTDVLEVYDWLLNKYPGQTPIIYGRSMGSAIAAHLAQHRPGLMLILETPFDQMESVFKTKFPFLYRPRIIKNNFDNIAPLQKGYSHAVHIIHGTKDRVVPLECAQRLKPFLKATDSFSIIPGGGHKNLSKFDEFQAALDLILGKRAELPKTG